MKEAYLIVVVIGNTNITICIRGCDTIFIYYYGLGYGSRCFTKLSVVLTHCDCCRLVVPHG